jgi:hypothetical protein
MSLVASGASGSTGPPSASRARLSAAVAAAVYLVLVLITVRQVLRGPATTLLFPLGFSEPMNQAFWVDQQFVTRRVVEVAHALGTRPWTVGVSGLCYPMPRAHTLGDHMFADGLLGLLPHALTGDPIATYNTVIVLTLWIAACAMYALVYHWTENVPAAFVAGCFFAFHFLKTGDPVHPYVHANQWTVLALLFAHRLFTHGRWRDAAGLVASVSLQLLESFYAVVSMAIILGVSGAHLAVCFRRRLRALAPKLLACAVAVSLVAVAVFAPYLHTRASWGVLGGRQTGLHAPGDFGPGGSAFPGYLPAVLGAVALLDRVRRRTHGVGDDPRLPLLAAAVLIAWVSMAPFHLPGTSLTVPAPLNLLQGVVPGLDAIRAAWNIGDGVLLIAAFLAGLGAALLLGACPRWARAIAATALVAVTLVDTVAPQSLGAFPGHFPLATWDVRTSADLLDLTSRLPDGAVLDVPYVAGKANPRLRAHYLLLSAYHLRPTAACHNSFPTPLGGTVEALVHRLPDVRAADALYALGFRSVVVHHEEAPAAVAPALEALQHLGRAREVARADGHTAYALETPLPVRTSLDVLAPDPPPDAVPVGRNLTHVTFAIRNPTTDIYRHPDPFEPTPCLIRWYADSGKLVATERERVLLPLALGAGERATSTAAVHVPADAGVYEVTLAPAETPDTIVGRLRVRVH